MVERKLKILYLALIVGMIFSCTDSYAKSIELNGISISLKTETSKKAIDKSNGANDEMFSTSEYEKEEKVPEDRYVKVELTISNDNNYEAANVTIEELNPLGFRQLEGDKNEKIMNTRIDSKLEKKYTYTYRYHKSYLKDQDNTILYDENGDIIVNNKDVGIDLRNSNIVKDANANNQTNRNDVKNGKIDEETSDLRKGVLRIALFLLIFVLCVILLIVFLMFYKTIKGNDNFFDNDSVFKCIIVYILLGLIINEAVNNHIIYAKNMYVPQFYEYGKSYEKVIYEPVYFNDGLYRFAYKITFTYENSYSISDEDYENDADGDGLVDALEYQYMTDKTNVDTDGDGLSDYLEVMYLDYNPLSDDTFNDGTIDCDRDFDNDKLTNIEEVRYGTDLSNVDTDYDTLSDYDEINVYNTNPLSVDTDEDFLSDPDELKLGLDPTNPKTDGVTLDSERKINQAYSMIKVPEDLRKGDIFISAISGNVSGNIDNEVKISINNEEVFNTMSSFVSSGFKVEMKEDETINISLDVEKVADRKTVLTIVKFEDKTIEVVDTTCVGNTLNADIGSGTYVVMDSEIVLRDLSIFINDYMP